jgi:hypothetical protein
MISDGRSWRLIATAMIVLLATGCSGSAGAGAQGSSDQGDQSGRQWGRPLSHGPVTTASGYSQSASVEFGTPTHRAATREFNCSSSDQSAARDLAPGMYAIPVRLTLTNPLDQDGRLYEIDETIGYTVDGRSGSVGAYNSTGALTSKSGSCAMTYNVGAHGSVAWSGVFGPFSAAQLATLTVTFAGSTLPLASVVPEGVNLPQG